MGSVRVTGSMKPFTISAHGLLLRETTGLEVEQLLVGHLGHGRFVTDHRVLGTDLHRGIGVGDGVVIEDECVTLHVALAAIGTVLHPDETAIRRAPTVLGDGLRHDLRRRLRCGVGHLGAGVLVLSLTGVGHRQHLARCLRTDHDDRGVLHREAGADVAVDPLHMALRFDPGPLRDQVEDVVGPVLDGRVGDPGRRLDDDLHDGGVQRIAGVDRRRAALDVVDLGALVRDDQRALELAHVLGVDPEIGLQRHLDLDAGGDIDERPTRPDRRVEGGELVVIRRDDLAEVLAHDLGILAHGGVHVAEDDALGGQLVPVAVEHHLGLVLGGDAGQVLPLGLGDAQLLVRVLDGVGEVLPDVDLPGGGLDVVVDVVEEDLRQIATPAGQRTAFEVAEGPEAEVQHPVLLGLHAGHLPYDGLVEPSPRA